MTFEKKGYIIIERSKDADKVRRCRLAVWRQLPKLFPASSTLVTCSKRRGQKRYHEEKTSQTRCFFLFSGQNRPVF